MRIWIIQASCHLTGRDFQGQIFSTAATADLCKIMLRDSANIQMFEAEAEPEGKKSRT